MPLAGLIQVGAVTLVRPREALVSADPLPTAHESVEQADRLPSLCGLGSDETCAGPSTIVRTRCDNRGFLHIKSWLLPAYAAYFRVFPFSASTIQVGNQDFKMVAREQPRARDTTSLCT